ncbi:probable inactive receptor kinase At4g23740 [Olea europaea var. sylvestris]|uniref:probable inactive receptor kinase At4g23740 n=1 Tax=Olea europaea var. sylvestris TaxID=158386 RepID=UPI000C1CD6B4|nr:probable inactive receptor kinase At4g23740 [Olea europaea var. sylvestris]
MIYLPSCSLSDSGYLAPEVADTKKLSQASDVYSFRVVLLELLTRQPTILTKVNEAIQLVSWVASVVRHEELTAEVFDIELLRYQNIEEEMVKFLQIALLCVDSVPGHRLKILGDGVFFLLQQNGVPLVTSFNLVDKEEFYC